MKKEWAWIIFLSLCIVLILPWSLLRWQKEKVTGDDVQVRVLMPGGGVDTLGLESYLVGVVAAEMPAMFEPEALAAQAVTARTYAAKRLAHPIQPDPGYDVDTTTKTQAWISDNDMRKRWGWFGFWRNRARIEQAVKVTRRKVLVFEGDYIDAFYHSSSGRKPTERAEDVWSSSRPYLQNRSSEEENPQRFIQHISFTRQQIAEKLGLSPVPKTFSSTDLKILSQTSAGRAKTISVLGRTYPASQFRTLLGLASTDVEWVIQPDELKITTYGNGHAVGMSQYGANDLAKKGMFYAEILAHYYPGAKLLTLG